MKETSERAEYPIASNSRAYITSSPLGLIGQSIEREYQNLRVAIWRELWAANHGVLAGAREINTLTSFSSCPLIFCWYTSGYPNPAGSQRAREPVHALYMVSFLVHKARRARMVSGSGKANRFLGSILWLHA